MQVDKRFMARALQLAKRGTGRTHPNPMVGAVVVKEGKVVGEGWHLGPGEMHAEALALKMAGPAAKGSTLYVNLEPCTHYGRTPPCTEIIIKTGILRVIAACDDPHPLVNGRGFERLREAGIEVISGFMRERAEELNRAFLHAVIRKTPYVTLKMATTLDGRIADASGRSKWITGAAARKIVHRLRSQADAVLVGAGTVFADDPQLNVRGVGGGRNPLRIILDPKLKTPLDSGIVCGAGDGKTLIVVDDNAEPVERVPFERKGVRFLNLPTKAGMFQWEDLAGYLMGKGILHLLVEGGARTATWFLARAAVSRLELFMAPKIMGESGLSAVQDLGIGCLEDVIRFHLRRCREVGGDIHITADAG